MSLRSTLSRARRGFREEIRLYAVAVTSLAVAFICLGASLLALQNLGALAEHWGESGRVTVFLRDGASPEEIQRLSTILEGLREVSGVSVISSAEAREQFLAQPSLGADLAELSPELFPASIEVGLVPGVSLASIEKLAARVGALEGVTDVESYRGWFEQLESLLGAGKVGALVIAILVGFCVFAVVGNTVRLSVARRRREIEVMKLCGATDGFVRGPFIVEGVAQGLMAALLSIAALSLGYWAVHAEVDAALVMIVGMPSTFLGPLSMAFLLVSGASIGAASSTLSLRRYLEI